MASNLTPRYLQDKRANFHELFYDLIFVYALQKIAHVLLQLTGNGTLTLNTFIIYILMSLFLWLLWAHQTVFTNRFGELLPKDVGFTIVNIFLLIFLSNSFYPDFNKTFVPFMTYM
ncbi:low temperature requirement protein A, partial [Staphylococcus simulans]